MDWFSAFLSGRTQRVVLGEAVSNWCNVTSGVPQGSVVGPILFNIFINDMPEYFTNTSKLYADDCKILAVVDTENQVLSLQQDINAAVSWSKLWMMELNVEKCKVMHMGKRNKRIKYTMPTSTSNTTHELQTTQNERDLGVIISDNGKFQHQVNSAVAKANSMMAILKNTFVSRDIYLWKKLYIAYIRPQLESAPKKRHIGARKSSEKSHKNTKSQQETHIRRKMFNFRYWFFRVEEVKRRSHTILQDCDGF